jgi:prepilin-type N-terminal cleavage/methylation domain-containing protein
MGNQKFYGFTLIEILIAILILGIVMATVIGTFTGIIFNSRHAEKRAELNQTGRALLDLISADIRGIYGKKIEAEGPFFLGTVETVEDLSVSKVDFITTNTLSIGLKRQLFLSEVGYHVKKNQEGDLYSLWRRAQSLPESPYEEGGRAVPVCRIVENFKLEFLSDNDIKEDLLHRIPVSIIINFTLNLDGERENFVTMVRPMISSGG